MKIIFSIYQMTKHKLNWALNYLKKKLIRTRCRNKKNRSKKKDIILTLKNDIKSDENPFYASSSRVIKF